MKTTPPPACRQFGHAWRASHRLLPLFTAGALALAAISRAAAPATPEIISVVDTSTSAASPQITWAAVANPSGGTPYYKVYRDGSTTALTTITNGATSYTDSSPTDPNTTDGLIDARHGTFSYRVSAVNPSTNEESAQSAAAYYGFRRTPFVMKWDDDRYSPATDFRATSWPGGASEPPRVTIGSDGVGLTANGQTVRFWGINFAYGSNIPSKADAPKIAARLAQFGVNLVRVHNLDDRPSEPVAGDSGHHGILKDPSAAFTGASNVNSTELDKFDFFVGELRKNFIYVDLNLRVGKDYPTPGGGTAGRYKGIDLYYADYITEQQAYASFFLNHTNPYAPNPAGGNHTYATDPAIAIVEINNEDGLISNWWGGAFDGTLNSSHRTELTTLWNNWLADTYGTGSAGTTALTAAWAPKTNSADFPAATELLSSGNFASGFTSPPWVLQATPSTLVSANPPAILTTGGPTGQPAVDIVVANSDTTAWHVQLLYRNVTADTTKPHTLRFHARIAEATPRTIRIGWRKYSDFTVLHDTEVELTNTWREYIVVFPARATSDGPIDVFFSDLARQVGHVQLASVSLKVGNAVAGGTSFTVESSTNGSDLVGNGQFPNTSSITANTGWTLTDPDSRVGATLGANSVVAGGGDGGGTGNNAVSIALTTPNESGGLYLRKTGLTFVAGRTYALTFHAKHSVNATSSNKMSVSGRTSSVIFLSNSIMPTTAWQTFTHVFTATVDTTDGWIDFALGNLPSGTSGTPGTFNLSQVTVAELPVIGLPSGEAMGSVSFPRRADFHTRSRAMQTDWLNFLWKTETDYWKAMRDHIVGITGSTNRPLIIGTQVDFSPGFLQAQDMDIVDSHSYWQHYSVYPSGILVAKNFPMAGTTDGANTVGARSGRRILGKPYLGTESGHGYPNTYGGEGPAFFGAYAAMQGWQGICMFCYEERNREETVTSAGKFDSGFEGVFTMGRAPAKMAAMPFAARALSVVSAAPDTNTAIAVVDKATIIETIRQKQRANLGATDFAGGAISTLQGFSTRVGQRMDPSDCYVVRPSVAPSGVITDPSGELTWDTTSATRRSLITTTTAKSFYGYYVPNTSISLGDGVSLSLNDSFQHRTNVGTSSTECWAGVSLTLKDGSSFGAAGSRWLVTTAGYTDNYKSTWQTYRGPVSHEDSPAENSAPASVGGSPSFVERISGTMTFNVGSGRLSAYSLDENGDRIAPLAVSYSSPYATVTIPTTTNTLWYEMSVDAPSTALTLSFPPNSNGYGAVGTTPIGIADTALAANSNTRTTDNTAWQKLGPSASDAVNLNLASDTTSPGNASGTNSVIISAGTATAGQTLGGWIDLRGQNIPSFKVWELEARLKFTSSTTDTVDDVHLVIGQDQTTFPVVHVALSRAIGGSSFGVQLQTAGGMMSPTTVASGTWVKVRVRVTPPGAAGAPAGGLLELWVNDVAQTLTNTALPSTTALPDELYIYTGATATGNAWIDEVKITIP